MVNQLQAKMTYQTSTFATSSEVTFTPRQMLWKVARKYPFKIFTSVIAGLSGALFNGVGTALIVPILLSLLGQDAILQEGPPIFQMLLAPFQKFARNLSLRCDGSGRTTIDCFEEPQ
jgi:subfamily B ATP-binding cassette protein MsbA